MGWSSANAIFNPIARTLVDLGATDEVKRRVLGDLIGGLQECDWDTEDESLEDFRDDPAIVGAFADHGVTMPCGVIAEDVIGHECTRTLGHDDSHADGQHVWTHAKTAG